MSLKNYIFASINTKATSTLPQFVDEPSSVRHRGQQTRPPIINRQPPAIVTPMAEAGATVPPTRGDGQQQQRHQQQQRNGHESTPRSVTDTDGEIPPNSTDATTQSDPPEEKNLIKRIWNFISVEPVLLCWLLPSCILYIAIDNLALEKACRVNLGYTDMVCDNMIDKSIQQIDCVDVRERLAANNYSIFDSENHIEDGQHHNYSAVITFINDQKNNVTFSLSELEYDVCMRAEVDSQILMTALNVYTASFDTIFGIIIILFAGGWSDRKNKRKPCMLLPLIGELSSLLVMLVAAVFMKQLPLEFSVILGKLLPALSGSQNLMLMGVYSYLTEMTPEKDRTFRYGIFAVFVTLIPLVSLPFSGILFQELNYIKLILLCIPINLFGMLYLIFVLKEVSPKNIEPAPADISATPSPRPTVLINNSTEHPMFELNEAGGGTGEHPPSSYHVNGHGRRSTVHIIKEKIEQNWCVQFFNPIVAVDCIRVISRRRPNSGRLIVMLLLVIYFLAVGPAFGEEPNEYNFVRIKLNWDGLTYSPYATYGNGIALIGTTLMLGALSKIFHLPDAITGFLATFSSALSRVVMISAATYTAMYVAQTINMFVSVRALICKSILTTLVDPTELGRLFSIIGIIEAFAKFAFVSIYSLVYESTLTTIPGAFYVCSVFCLIATSILFIVVYVLLRRKAKQDIMDKEHEEATEAKRRETMATLKARSSSLAPILSSSGGENTHM